MADSKQGNSNMMFGFLFTLIAIVALIALVLTKSQADNVASEATVTNANPTVDNVTIALSSGGTASDVTLTAGSTKTVYIRGQASDNNGCEDINDADGTTEKFTAKFFRTDVSGGSACTADNKNCYEVTEGDSGLSGCTTGGTDLNIAYEFSVPVQYYADATDDNSSPDHASTNWTAYVLVTDANAGTGSNTSTAEVATVKGLSMATETLGYGSLSLGGTSSDQEVTLINEGNHNAFDPVVSMSANWSCTIGSIDKADTKWSASSGTAYTSMTSMSTDPASVDLNIAKSTDGTDSEGSFFTKLKVPSTGVGGSCTSTLVVGAGT